MPTSPLTRATRPQGTEAEYAKTPPRNFGESFRTALSPFRAARRNTISKQEGWNGKTSRTAWWLWPHLLGLDAPLVALTWQWWWGKTARVEVSWSHVCVLGLGVWLIYLADRLADVSGSSADEPRTSRHAFHARNRVVVSALVITVSALLIGLAPNVLSKAEFWRGLLFLLIATTYFWHIHVRGQHRWTSLMPKEMVVGGLFAIGTAFFPMGQMERIHWEFLFAVGLFGVLCFCNCGLISSWERHLEDLRDPASLLNAFPTLARRLPILCLAVPCLAGGFSLHARTPIFLPLAASGLALALLDHFRRRFSSDALRVLVDAVLLTPLLVIYLLRR